MPWRPRSVGQLSPAEAHRQLVEGNHRFAVHSGDEKSRRWDPRHASVQAPVAAVLGCSDSRAPVELVFDQGLGDLFVVRNAGNIVGPAVIGSIEFAVSQLGVPLVVVLGHTRCNAVGAAVVEIEQRAPALSTASVLSITAQIRPQLLPVVEASTARDGPGRELMLRACMRANVQASLRQITETSDLLRDAAGKGRVWLVGAEYELETGVVHWLTG